MYKPLFAITSDEEEKARAIVKHLLTNGGDGLKKALRGNNGMSIIHSWDDVFGASTDAACGLRKYLPHVLFVYITPDDMDRLQNNSNWRFMELCQLHLFPAICLYEPTERTLLTAHVDVAGTWHRTRYSVPDSLFKK